MISALFKVMTKKKSFDMLDFETAAELAKNDPQAFEQYRLQAIEDLIASVPEKEQLHLRRLQWRIDQVRERSANPLDACVKLHSMMWDSFAGKGGLVDTLNNFQNSSYSINSRLPAARVLAFPGAGGELNDTDR